MSEIPRHWRLKDPSVYHEVNMEPCNEPLTLDGVVIAHCQILVKRETKRRPRKEHKQRHRLEWR